MKLLIVGSSGFVAREAIRQSLERSDITSVVALGRRAVTAPTDLSANADASKLKSVVIKDYGEWPVDIKEQLGDIDACIWTVAVIPGEAKKMPFEELHKICHDYTIIGLHAIYEARGSTAGSRPLRFMYMSGAMTERDRTKTPWIYPEYMYLRGKTETEVLAFAKEHSKQIEANVVKPAMIYGQDWSMRGIIGPIVGMLTAAVAISVVDCSRAMLDQIVNGVEKETLHNSDLLRISKQALKKRASAS